MIGHMFDTTVCFAVANNNKTGMQPGLGCDDLYLGVGVYVANDIQKATFKGWAIRALGNGRS